MLNVKSNLKLLVTRALKNIPSQGEFIDQLVTKNLIFIVSKDSCSYFDIFAPLNSL